MPVVLQHYIYISQASPQFPVTEFGRICRISRSRNAGANIQGALLFDGHRYAQWLQGPTAAMESLRIAIAKDPRHLDLHTLLWRQAPAVPDVAGWSAGFVEPEALDCLLMPECRDATRDAVRAFLALLPLSDLGDFSAETRY